ncbi:MAG TPA: hypothetical protein VJ971_16550 [Methylomirabilota bacterium]|nr:hypothetical protein [Methylomirabilota bacterium]
MKTKPWLLATMAILALAGVGPATPAGALSATSSVDSRLRLDWEVGARHGGRPVIQGYLYNDYLRSAAEVRLLVETLDASGGVTARQVGFVRGVIPFKDRAYFEVSVKTAGASYRVSITAFDWKDCGGGAGGGGM